MKIGKKGIGLLVVFSLLVLALGMVVMMMMPSVVADDSGVYFVMEDGSEIPIEQYLMESGGRTDLPNSVILAVFLGAAAGLIGSTYLPFYFEWKKDKRTFDYSYLYNALTSAIAAALLMIIGLPAATPAWFAGVVAFTSSSGGTLTGSKFIDKTRKTVVTNAK